MTKAKTKKLSAFLDGEYIHNNLSITVFCGLRVCAHTAVYRCIKKLSKKAKQIGSLAFQFHYFAHLVAKSWDIYQWNVAQQKYDAGNLHTRMETVTPPTTSSNSSKNGADLSQKKRKCDWYRKKDTKFLRNFREHTHTCVYCTHCVHIHVQRVARIEHWALNT